MQENNISKNTALAIAAEEDAALIKIRKTIFKYLSHWYLFAMLIIAGLVVAYFYLKYTNPVYKTGATLLLVRDDKGTGGEKDLIDALVSGKPKVNVQDEIELIKSRYLLNKVVDKHQLCMEVWVRGRIKTTELGTQLPFHVEGPYGGDTSENARFTLNFIRSNQFKVSNEKDDRTYTFFQPFKVGKKTYKLQPESVEQPQPNTEYQVYLFNKQTAASKISDNLKINPKSTLSRVVDLSYSGTNVAKIQFVLQKVMEEYVQLGVDEKKKVQQNTLQFINERLDVLSGELGGVESQLENFRRSNNVVDVKSQSQQFLGDVSDQTRDLSKLLVRKQVIDYLLNYLNTGSASYNLAPTNLGIEDPVLLTLSQGYNSLILEREKELIINTEISPVIKNLEATIDKARTSLLENLKSIKNSNDMLINKIAGDKNRAQSMLSQVPGKERQLGGIMRQEKIKNDLFSYLLQKREETEISLAGAVSEAKILNSSLVSPTPISPDRKMIWIMAFASAVVISLLIIWIKDLLNNKVTTKNDVTDSLKIPLIGEVGHNVSKDSIVVKQASRKVIGEQFRNIRSNIHFMVPNKNKFVLLTTSSNAGEGKSFVSINLAATYAVAGKKTLLIELDLRKPKLSRYLNIQGKSGLTDYLIGQSDMSAIVNSVAGYEDFSIIVAGSIPPNPAELLMHEKMHALMTDLKQEYDVIILDCPPVGLVSDAQIVADYADLSVYIIRQRYTLKSQLLFINELHEAQRLKHIGIIVNDVKVGGHYGYYGYGNHSYRSYGYGSKNGQQLQGQYFEDDDSRGSWLSRVFNKN